MLGSSISPLWYHLVFWAMKDEDMSDQLSTSYFKLPFSRMTEAAFPRCFLHPRAKKWLWDAIIIDHDSSNRWYMFSPCKRIRLHQITVHVFSGTCLISLATIMFSCCLSLFLIIHRRKKSSLGHLFIPKFIKHLA